MSDKAKIGRAEKIRLIVFPSLLAALLGFLLSSNSIIRPAQAFSSGPPAGYTGAPGEEPEACAECHVPADAGTGHISINAPQTYVPGQTYPITVTHTNPDPSRIRWGFELTVLKNSDNTTAGSLQTKDVLTAILSSGARTYIGHNGNFLGPPPPVDPQDGTFWGIFNGPVTWNFSWTAPPQGTGPVTFYAAGNAANGNNINDAGDQVYTKTLTLTEGSLTPVTTTTWGKIKQLFR